MFVTLLTKSTGFLGPIVNLLGLIMNGIYEFFYMFGIQNIALSIFVFTFITKSLMLPLTIKQQKSSKLSSKMNPELQKIQAKYKGKRDEASLRKSQAETQAVYQKYGASPTSGCLPLLISLPIMLALYQVINNIPAHVNEVKELYATVAESITSVDGFNAKLAEIIKDAKINIDAAKITEIDKIIDVLVKIPNWDKLKEVFPSAKNVIETTLPNINKVNEFFGLNITSTPGWAFPGILIPLLAMALQFIQGKQMEVKNKAGNTDNPAASAMSSMNVVMPIMSGVFCIALPIGVGLYWIASSLFAIIQNFFVNKYMDRIDIDEMIEKNREKASKRRGNASSVTGSSLQELAKKQTKTIESSVSEKNKYSEKEDLSESKEKKEEDKSERTSYNPSSISDIANLLKNRNSEKGDK